MLTKKDFNTQLLQEAETENQNKTQLTKPFESNEVGASIVQNKTNIILVVFLVIASFLLGSTWSKVNLLEKQAQVGQNGGNLQAEANIPSGDNIPNTNPPQEVAIDPSKIDKLTVADHILGNPNARLQLIVYSDLECPFSKRFQSTIKQIADQYKDKIVIAYRHFPLDQIHPQTRTEAQATECAAKLNGNDGFWKLTDKIYEITSSNNGLDLTTLPALASQSGLNQTAFKTCLSSGEMAQTVEAQYQSGLKAGVNGTPGSFLIDSKTGTVKAIQGAQPFEQIKPIIDQLLTE